MIIIELVNKGPSDHIRGGDVNVYKDNDSYILSHYHILMS